MDSFYEYLYLSIESFQNEICTKNNKLFQHNHQPVRFLVDDCFYCKLYGNVLETSKTLDNNLFEIGTSQDTITYSIHYKIFD